MNNVIPVIYPVFRPWQFCHCKWKYLQNVDPQTGYHPSCPGELQGSHRLEKYLNLEVFLEKSLKIKSALKSTGKLLKSLEKSLNSSIFCRT